MSVLKGLAMRKNKGFSLIELSIVLVILGLLTGGILAGQSLIRAAEIRSVSAEYSRYVTAMGTFRDKYFAFPGDMNNAVSFWTAASACPGVAGTASTGVCNGDGNGMLGTTTSSSNEIFGAWEHLAMAGLVEGSYTGNTTHASTASSPTSTFGVNIPRSKVGNAGWSVYYISQTLISNTSFFDGNYGNILFFGGVSGSNVAFEPILKPEEAWNIDTKLDDGKPAIGIVRTREVDGAACTDLASSASVSLAASAYLLTNTANACSLIMLTGY